MAPSLPQASVTDNNKRQINKRKVKQSYLIKVLHDAEDSRNKESRTQGSLTLFVDSQVEIRSTGQRECEHTRREAQHGLSAQLPFGFSVYLFFRPGHGIWVGTP